MSVFDEDSTPLSRHDFSCRNDWLRHCHTAGEHPFDDDEGPCGFSGAGYYAQLFNGIFGHTPRQFQRTMGMFGVSRVLKLSQVERNFRAIAFANCLGMILNTKIDITLSTLGIVDDVAVAAITRAFCAWLRLWLTRHGVPSAYVWTLERAATLGLHTHLLVHVPSAFQLPEAMKLAGTKGARFSDQAKAALARIANRPLLDGTERKTVLIRHRGCKDDLTFQWIWFDYRSKGLGRDQRAEAERLGLYRTSDQGTVATKRTGVSRLLDDTNVKRFAYMNRFPSFTPDESGRLPMDDRFFRHHQHSGMPVAWPAVSLNGNLKSRGDFQLDDIDLANLRH